MHDKRKSKSPVRSPYSRWLRAHGHKVVRDKTTYRRKAKHKKNPAGETQRGFSFREVPQITKAVSSTPNPSRRNF